MASLTAPKRLRRCPRRVARADSGKINRSFRPAQFLPGSAEAPRCAARSLVCLFDVVVWTPIFARASYEPAQLPPPRKALPLRRTARRQHIARLANCLHEGARDAGRDGRVLRPATPACGHFSSARSGVASRPNGRRVRSARTLSEITRSPNCAGPRSRVSTTPSLGWPNLAPNRRAAGRGSNRRLRPFTLP